MAGRGDRFVQAGYQDPKPLIKVNGKRILQYIVEMFDPSDEMIFICNETHLRETQMRSILEELAPGSQVISIPDHKKGPVYTVKDASIYDIIEDDEEIIICYCDNPYLWDYEHFKNWIHHNNSDGCILSHTGFHPHRLSSTYMAYMKENDLEISEIKEKEPYTDNPMDEHASTGTYYFRKGSYIKKYFDMLLEEGLHHKGEYYVTLVYNLLIRDGLRVHCYPTDFVTVFGTPEEVENFEAWQKILAGKQIKNESDLIKCYRYWIGYNERSSQ